MKKLLLYTIAYDIDNSACNRMMAKMLAASCIRSGFTGDILLFHNGDDELFPCGRTNVKEIRITHEDLPHEPWRRTPHRLKFTLRNLVPAHEYDSVLFLDSDSLAIRNPAKLFDNCKGIIFQPERGLKIQRQQFNSYLSDYEMDYLNRDGVNSGSFAVEGRLFHEVMTDWDVIDCGQPVRGEEKHEQGAWNRYILDTTHPTNSFEDGLIDFPFFPVSIIQSIMDASNPPHLLTHLDSERFCNAHVLHTLGPMPSERRMAMTFGLFIARFFADPGMRLLNLLEP